ncbi:MAG: hypothetical protein PHY45_00775 [Rhodocyclaceae bacterium]|nr:hypothetical protein [Rhodocyclaceae bacterium]
MPLEISETYARPYRPPLYNLRWSAVFAGLAVGVSANLFLLLLGAAVGLAVFNAGAKMNEDGLVLAASLWDTFCMVVASLIGGYVAARASGMRRTADGILHGILAWSVAVLGFVLLATSTVGDTLGGMFNSLLNRPVAAEAMHPLGDAERQAIAADLENRFGLDRQQANGIVDEILALSGREGKTNGEAGADAEQNLHAATVLSGWLSTAILLSLLGAVGGGMVGSRATRRSVGKELRRARLPEKGDALRAEAMRRHDA